MFGALKIVTIILLNMPAYAQHSGTMPAYDGPVYQPSQAESDWFEHLKRPDYDAVTMGSVVSCCDAGDGYPIVILEEATIGGTQKDGLAEVIDPSARMIVKPNGEKKWRPEWTAPRQFHFAGKIITREIDGNPTKTAWVFASLDFGVPREIYCIVPLPPGF